MEGAAEEPAANMANTTNNNKKRKEPTGSKDATVVIDTRGDLRLKVGQDDEADDEAGDDDHCVKVFVVDSRALSRASPVFNAMLNGPWAEQQPAMGGDWTVSLPEDSPLGLEVLLNIIHSRFKLVPENPSIDALFYITVLADKYDVAELLKPWAKDWCNAYRASAEKPDHEPLIWVAWVLGDADLLLSAAKYLLLRIFIYGPSVNVDEKNIQDLPCYEYLKSTGALDLIIILRSRVVSDVLDVLDTEWKMWVGSGLAGSRGNARPGGPGQPARTLCRLANSNYPEKVYRACEATILGSFTHGLHRNALFPVPRLENVTLSILALRANIKAACDCVVTMPASRDPHSGCGIGGKIMDMVDRLIEKALFRMKDLLDDLKKKKAGKPRS